MELIFFYFLKINFICIKEKGKRVVMGVFNSEGWVYIRSEGFILFIEEWDFFLRD